MVFRGEVGIRVYKVNGGQAGALPILEVVGLGVGGTAAGSDRKKQKTVAVGILQDVFCRQGWTDFRFVAGGTGVVRALVQMLGLRLGGTAAGRDR